MKSSSHTIEDLLAGTGRIAVLRALAAAPGPLTGRQVASLAQTSHAGAMRVLDRLVAMGVVLRTPVGRAFLHELDRDNAVVSAIVVPLFEAEGLLPTATHALLAAEARVPYVNETVRPHLSAIEASCRRHHVVRAALFGSATQTESGVVPSDLDLLVTFESLAPRMKAEAYAELTEELERIMGMPVDVMVSTAVRNSYLAEEIERTQVVLYEVA